MGEAPRPLTTFRAGNFADADLARAGVFDFIDTSSVDEEHEFVLPDDVGNFRGELMQAKDLYFFSGELALQNLGRAPGDSIVATQRIAVSEDENSKTHGYTE